MQQHSQDKEHDNAKASDTKDVGKDTGITDLSSVDVSNSPLQPQDVAYLAQEVEILAQNAQELVEQTQAITNTAQELADKAQVLSQVENVNPEDLVPTLLAADAQLAADVNNIAAVEQTTDYPSVTQATAQVSTQAPRLSKAANATDGTEITQALGTTHHLSVTTPDLSKATPEQSAQIVANIQQLAQEHAADLSAAAANATASVLDAVKAAQIASEAAAKAAQAAVIAQEQLEELRRLELLAQAERITHTISLQAAADSADNNAGGNSGVTTDRGGRISFDTVTEFQLDLQKRLPRTFWLITLLAILTSFSGLTNNSFTPAITAIADHFQVNLEQVQQIIAYYTIGMGVGQLLWGPFMDRFGRKILIILCAVLGVGVNAWLILANNYIELQIIRFLQGVVFSGLSIVPRVMLRDTYSPRQYTVYNSWIITIFLFAPVVAPLVGGYIYLHFGWQNIFTFISGFLLIMLTLFIFLIPETLDPSKRQSFRPLKILSNYFFIISKPNSLFLMFINALYTVSIVSFPTLLPAIYMQDYHVPPHLFGYCMIVNLVTIAAGTQINQVLIGRGGNPAIIWRNSAVLQALFTTVNFVVAWYFLGLWGVMLSIGVNLLFNGFLNGNLVTIYLLDYSNMTGTANSLITATRLIFAGYIVSQISHLDRHNGATLLYTNAIIIIACAILILIYCAIYRPQDRDTSVRKKKSATSDNTASKAQVTPA